MEAAGCARRLLRSLLYVLNPLDLISEFDLEVCR